MNFDLLHNLTTHKLFWKTSQLADLRVAFQDLSDLQNIW